MLHRAFVVTFASCLLAAGPSWSQSGCCDASPAGSAEWRVDRFVDGEPPWIGADGGGGVHVLFLDGTYVHAVSRDAGRTWSSASPSATPDAIRATGALRSDGSLVLAWVDGSRRLFARASDDSGRTFGAPVLVGTLRTDDRPLVLEMRLGETGLAGIFLHVLGAPPTFEDRSFVAGSPDAGATWGPLTAVGVDRVTSGVQPLTVTGEAVIAAWSEFGEARVTRWRNPADGWSPPVVASRTSAWVRSACVASSGDFVQLAVRTADETRVSVSRDSGATWPPADERVAGGSARIDDVPRMATWADGIVALLAGADTDGVHVVRSFKHGLPGTWDADSARFSFGVDRPHHFREAASPGGLLVAHDDYRHHEPSCPPRDTVSCESIHVACSIDRGRTFDPEEHRVDDDLTTPAVHSEDPEIAVAPDGRAHVVWIESDLGLDGIETVSIARVASFDPILAYPPVPSISREASRCNPEIVGAAADPALWSWCRDPLLEWILDGSPVPGEHGARIDLDASRLASGDHSLQLVVRCTDPIDCAPASTVMVFGIAPGDPPRPADVGPVLRATGHGDPRAADITATFTWAGDRGLPRGSGEHYHVQRSRDPRSLPRLLEIEPWTATSIVDSTPAGSSLPWIHFYRVVAADACEVESRD